MQEGLGHDGLLPLPLQKQLVQAIAHPQGLLEACAEARGRSEVDAHDEGFDAAGPTAPWLCDNHLLEEDLELRVENVDVSGTEDLGDEFTARFEHTQGEVQSSEQQLSLDVDIEVVEAGNVWCTVADDQVNRTGALVGIGSLVCVVGRVEDRQQKRDGGGMCDIGSEGRDARKRRDGLQVDRDNLDVLARLRLGVLLGQVPLHLLLLLLAQPFLREHAEELLADPGLSVLPRRAAKLLALDENSGEDLGPAPWRGAEIDDAGDVGEEIELYINRSAHVN